ncbi:MAG: acyltransferase family protein [Agriterribacter sp.]
MVPDSKHVPFLDGFRAYAILLVILGHLNKTFISLAQTGVTLFFFVSGFLITKLLIAEYNATGKVRLRQFYIRRFLRLYPALIFLLVVLCIVILCFGYKVIMSDISAGLFYYTNYYRIYFMPALPTTNYPSPGILWSLAVEEHYYLVFPIIFSLGFKYRNGLFLALLCASVISFFFIRMFVFKTSDDIAEAIRKIYILTHCRADSILYGCIAALLLYAHKAKWYIQALRSPVSVIASIAVLAIVQLVPGYFFQNTLKFSIQGIALGFLIPSFLFYESRNPLMRLMENQAIIYIGKLSYSLYLFHWMALAICNLYFPSKNILWYILFFAATILLSLGSYNLVEQPFLSLRRKFGSHAR